MRNLENLLTNSEIKTAYYNEHHPFEILPLQGIQQYSYDKIYKVDHLSKNRILIVKKGKGEIIIDSVKLPLLSNTVYCLSSGQVYQLKNEDDLEGYIISFTTSFLGFDHNNVMDPIFRNRLFNHLNSGAIIKIDEKIYDELLYLLISMSREYLSGDSLKMEIIKQYLQITLIILSRKVSPRQMIESSTSKIQLVNRFFIMVQKNFLTKKQVVEYASLLGVSPNYLNNCIKKASGFPASHHIQQHIIQEAKRRAAYSDRNMKEIAFSLGFEEITHFSKFFKKMEGITFSQYRKKIYNEMTS